MTRPSGWVIGLVALALAALPTGCGAVTPTPSPNSTPTLSPSPTVSPVTWPTRWKLADYLAGNWGYNFTLSESGEALITKALDGTKIGIGGPASGSADVAIKSGVDDTALMKHAGRVLSWWGQADDLDTLQALITRGRGWEGGSFSASVPLASGDGYMNVVTVPGMNLILRITSEALFDPPPA